MENSSISYANSGENYSFFCQIRQDTQREVFQKVFHTQLFLGRKAMENSVDNMEKQVKSRAFS